MNHSLLVFTLICFFQFSLFGQTKDFDFKKGEVMDILLLNAKREAKQKLDYYFKTAIPIAMNMGYVPQKGFSVPESPTAGNYHPESLIVGKWTGLEVRYAALKGLESEMEGFHQLRRDIWSNFFVTYYALNKDVKFQVDADRYNVALALWADKKALKRIEQSILKSNGSILLNLKDGQSPYGYHYNPDAFLIISWEKDSDFLKYKEDVAMIEAKKVRHINEFRID